MQIRKINKRKYPNNPMKKTIIFCILFLISFLPNTHANSVQNDTLFVSSPINATIFFDIATTFNEAIIESNSIYILNITDSSGQNCNINYTTINSVLIFSNYSCNVTALLPVGGGSGRGYIIPNATEEKLNITCSINSLNGLGNCVYLAGARIWPSTPHAGVIILIFLSYLILMLLTIKNKKNNKTAIYNLFKILFYIIIILVLFIITVWSIRGCEIVKVSDLGTCIYEFGGEIWPNSPKSGLFILFALVGIILLFIVLTIKRKKPKKLNSSLSSK
jgi:hypothetical protein